MNCGYEIELSRILVRDVDKPRGVQVQREIIATNIEDILNDESIKIV